MARGPSIEGLLRQLEQAAQAGRSLDGVYVVSGDEPLLLTEALDGLRAVAGKAGYLERTSLVMDARSDWSMVMGAMQNISLFGDQRLVEVSVPGGKPGKTGAETLLKLADLTQTQGLSDTLLIISLPRLDKTTRNSKWAQGLFEAGTSVEIASIGRPALPRWIAQRLARQNQQLDPATLEWMADKVEGNLLSAHQEVQKL